MGPFCLGVGLRVLLAEYLGKRGQQRLVEIVRRRLRDRRLCRRVRRRQLGLSPLGARRISGSGFAADGGSPGGAAGFGGSARSAAAWVTAAISDASISAERGAGIGRPVAAAGRIFCSRAARPTATPAGMQADRSLADRARSAAALPEASTAAISDASSASAGRPVMTVARPARRGVLGRGDVGRDDRPGRRRWPRWLRPVQAAAPAAGRHAPAR